LAGVVSFPFSWHPHRAVSFSNQPVLWKSFQISVSDKREKNEFRCRKKGPPKQEARETHPFLPEEIKEGSGLPHDLLDLQLLHFLLLKLNFRGGQQIYRLLPFRQKLLKVRV